MVELNNSPRDIRGMWGRLIFRMVVSLDQQDGFFIIINTHTLTTQAYTNLFHSNTATECPV